MKLLRGKKVADKILCDIKSKIKKQGLKPSLSVILVGENKASKLYIKLKARAAKKVGIGFQIFKFRSSVREKAIVSLIKKLNKDERIDGIIVQLPLPKKFDTQKIISSISPKKDVDGFHPKNIKLFQKGREKLRPVFPEAIIRLIESGNTPLRKKRGIVIANSEKFGNIMVAALERKGIKAEYFLYNKLKTNLNKIKSADIIVTAVGMPKLIKGGMAKKGALIIDGGIKKREKKVYGDVDFNSAAKTAGYLSPVPGGVGPVTVACLLENVYKAAKIQK